MTEKEEKKSLAITPRFKAITIRKKVITPSKKA